jgi:hypothetical protein
MNSNNSPWILSARFDCCFILAPAILASLIAVLFSGYFQTFQEMPPWLWLVLIVGIDAGHVYSSLFRTYFDKQAFANQSPLLTLTPLMAWLIGTLLYSIDSLWFWRVLAYLAVFHFIRQQYGFMMIYARHEHNYPKAYRLINKIMLYSATLYPLMVWHTSGRSFNWFVDDDFIVINNPALNAIAGWFFLGLMCCYVLKEVLIWHQFRHFNLPRNVLVIGTALSWHIGIVAYDNDLIFTATNVIAHGIPYYALIWVYGYNCNRMHRNAYTFSWLSKLFSNYTIPFYVGLLFALAYVEEGFWDGFIWREHPYLFALFNNLPGINSAQTLVWLIPLLTVPQATHYVLDAFIWRIHAKNSEWKRILFNAEYR